MAGIAADLILQNGKIATLNTTSAQAQAMAVWQGRILAIGSNSDVAGLAGPGTKTIDLKGRRVVPGIIDSHCHPDSHAISLLRWTDVGPSAIKSVDELLQFVHKRTSELAPDKPLLGFCYNDKKQGGYPTREQLDAVSNGRPVWIYRTDHHIAVLNTPMLTAMGVGDNTHNPPHGQFDRDPKTGRMTGLAWRGSTLSFGDYGLKAMVCGWITNRQIEAARIAMTRHIKRGGKVWIRVFPDKPVSKKPAETRMGKGKGAPEFWVAVIRPGKILFEMEGVSPEIAAEAMRLAAQKLSLKTKMVSREQQG